MDQPVERQRGSTDEKRQPSTQNYLLEGSLGGRQATQTFQPVSALQGKLKSLYFITLLLFNKMFNKPLLETFWRNMIHPVTLPKGNNCLYRWSWYPQGIASGPLTCRYQNPQIIKSTDLAPFAL